MATLQAVSVIIETAGLSFLGLGAQPPSPDWGTLLSEGQDYFLTAWWIATFPGLRYSDRVWASTCWANVLRRGFEPRAPNDGTAASG